MGEIRLRFKAQRGTKREIFTAFVDGGADMTNLNLDTACELGLDTSRPPAAQMKLPGGAILRGYELSNVELSRGRRRAKISVFVPVEVQIGKTRRKVPPDDEQLIGHDFLQAAGAKVDYSTHDLQSAHQPTRGIIVGMRRGIYRRLTSAEAATLLPVSCPVPKRRRRRRTR